MSDEDFLPYQPMHEGRTNPWRWIVVALAVMGLSTALAIALLFEEGGDRDKAIQELIQANQSNERAVEKLCEDKPDDPTCEAAEDIPDTSDIVDEAEVQDAEVQEPEIQEPEIQEPEGQDPEGQDPEKQDPDPDDPDPDDPDPNDPDPDDPEIQDEENQQPEIQDEEIQDEEIQDEEIQDDDTSPESFTFEFGGQTYTCTDPDQDGNYACQSSGPGVGGR